MAGALQSREVEARKPRPDSCRAGGVGVFAIQIAKAFGAMVAATASTRNLDFLRHLGADLAIDYTREKIQEKVSGYDIVLDGVGKQVWSGSFNVLRFGGRLVTLAVPIPDKPSNRLRFYGSADRKSVV